MRKAEQYSKAPVQSPLAARLGAQPTFAIVPTALPTRATQLPRYTRTAIALHWLIALLIMGNIGLAWWFNTLKGPAEVGPLGLHKSIGSPCCCSARSG